MGMAFDHDDLKVLSDLGLSQNQARIYLSLLKLGIDSKAVSIFKYSGVARQDVYRVLHELEELSIVQKIISKPVRFRPVMPKKAVLTLLEKKLSSMTRLNEEADLFVKRLDELHVERTYSHERNEFLLLSEKRALIRKCKEEIENAKISVDSIAPSKEFLLWLETLYDAFRFAALGSARIRWVIEEPKEEERNKIERYIQNLPQLELKYARTVPIVKFGIYDKRQIILATFAEGDFAEAPALWSNSPVIVELARNYFDFYWRNGKKINLS